MEFFYNLYSKGIFQLSHPRNTAFENLFYTIKHLELPSNFFNIAKNNLLANAD